MILVLWFTLVQTLNNTSSSSNIWSELEGDTQLELSDIMTDSVNSTPTKSQQRELKIEDDYYGLNSTIGNKADRIPSLKKKMPLK